VGDIFDEAMVTPISRRKAQEMPEFKIKPAVNFQLSILALINDQSVSSGSSHEQAYKGWNTHICEKKLSVVVREKNNL